MSGMLALQGLYLQTTGKLVYNKSITAPTGLPGTPPLHNKEHGCER